MFRLLAFVDLSYNQICYDRFIVFIYRYMNDGKMMVEKKKKIQNQIIQIRKETKNKIKFQDKANN